MLLVRGDDQKIRAFLNACRHRGTELICAEFGSVRKFICPYHAWTYERDGQLSGVPDEYGFPSLKKQYGGLVELPMWVRNGLMWAVPAADVTNFDFEQFWSPLAADMAALELDDAVLFEPESRQ